MFQSRDRKGAVLAVSALANAQTISHADRPASIAPKRRPTAVQYSKNMELIFEVRDAEEGGYFARALGHGVFTEAETWNELRANVREAVELHFEDEPVRPRLVQLHYVKDELMDLEAA